MNGLLRDWKKSLGDRGELSWNMYLMETLSWECIPLTDSQYEFKSIMF